MVGTLSEEKKRLLYEHIFAVVNKNKTLAMNFYEGMGMISPKTDLEKLESLVEVFIDKYHNKTLQNINLKEMVLEIIELVRECNLYLPTTLAYLGKASIGLDGLIRYLDPNFNPTERLTKFLTKSTKDYIKEKFEEAMDIANFYYNLSFKLDRIIKTLNIERLTFRVIFKDVEELQEFYKNQINKIVLAIIFFAFLASSALFHLSNQHSIANLMLYIAVFMFVILLYKIVRQ